MRASSLIPLAFVVLAGGCGSGPEETGRSAAVPARDLTLQQAPAPAIQVASPVEAPRPRPERPTVHRPRRSPRPSPAPSPQSAPPDASPVAEAVAAPAAAPAPAPASRPAVDAAPAKARALEPGETVTIIPASSGPSVGSDPADAPPSRAGRAILIGRGHGGTCQPRGAMRGVAPVPLPAPRLR
jgi:hypothetical protein